MKIILLSLFFFNLSFAEKTKKTTFFIQPFGYGPSQTFTVGPSLSYQLNPSSSLIMEYMANLYTLSGVGEGESVSRKWDGRSFGLHYKRFLIENFYARAGYDQRLLSYYYTQHDERSGFEATSHVLSLSVGHQLFWEEGYTIGCDWVGVVIPLGAKVNSETIGELYNSDNKSNIAIEKRRLLTKTGYQTLRLYFGMMF